MISIKDLANMSVQDLAKAAETRQQELAQIYQAMAAKVTPKTAGKAFLKGNNIVSADYYLNVAKNHPEILSSTFDVNDFENSILFFKTSSDMKIQEANTAVLLKTPRDQASQICCWAISYIRKRVKELEADPIFKLILQNEPNPREPYKRTPSKI
jgi:hypothetical protein